MSNHRRWTKDEEQVVLSHVRDNSGNLSEAFRKAALELGRTKGAVGMRWYYKLRLEGQCFLTIGSNVYTNSKISNLSSKSIKESLFKKIIKLIFTHKD